MSNVIVYNEDKEIQRTVICPLGMANMQAGPGEFVIEGVADDQTQKMEFDGLDESGRPINPWLVDKSPAEILADNPPLPEVLEENKPARMTKGELAALVKRIENLENLTENAR